jgi:hypothetical protein
MDDNLKSKNEAPYEEVSEKGLRWRVVVWLMLASIVVTLVFPSIRNLQSTPCLFWIFLSAMVISFEGLKIAIIGTNYAYNWLQRRYDQMLSDRNETQTTTLHVSQSVVTLGDDGEIINVVDEEKRKRAGESKI